MSLYVSLEQVVVMIFLSVVHTAQVEIKLFTQDGHTATYAHDQLTSRMVIGADRAVVEDHAGLENSHSTFWIHDHLGTVAASINIDGIVGHGCYRWPFGEDMLCESNDQIPPMTTGYTGQERDQASGWYDYNARFYDPAIGRFLAADVLAKAYPSTSPYSYVLNKPLTHTDPSGAFVVPAPAFAAAWVYAKIQSWFIAGSLMAGTATTFVMTQPGSIEMAIVEVDEILQASREGQAMAVALAMTPGQGDRIGRFLWRSNSADEILALPFIELTNTITVLTDRLATQRQLLAELSQRRFEHDTAPQVVNRLLDGAHDDIQAVLDTAADLRMAINEFSRRVTRRRDIAEVTNDVRIDVLSQQSLPSTLQSTLQAGDGYVGQVTEWVRSLEHHANLD